MNTSSTTRVAAVGDIHIKETDKGKWAGMFSDLAAKADVLLICGDITDTGKKEEAEVVLNELKSCSIPVVGVLGNHDHQSGQPEEVAEILRKGMHVLDGDSVIIGSVGFAGVKGFSGGFDRYRMPAYGEEINKVFVQEVINEADKLDRALLQLEEQDTDIKKVAVLHYAPVEETIIGEPVRIFSFLGSSYLKDPLEKRNVEVAFHGHAHAGTLKGITPKGIPVYNVSVPVLLNNGFKIPFYLMDI